MVSHRLNIHFISFDKLRVFPWLATIHILQRIQTNLMCSIWKKTRMSSALVCTIFKCPAFRCALFDLLNRIFLFFFHFVDTKKKTKTFFFITVLLSVGGLGLLRERKKYFAITSKYR